MNIKYFIFIIIIVIIIISLIINKENFTSINIDFINKNNFNSIIFKNYLKKLNIYELGHKTGIYDLNKEKYLKIYINSIQSFSKKEKVIIKNIIYDLNKKFNYTFLNNWKLVKIKDIEFNFPFTLDNIIFLPENVVNSMENNNRSRKLLFHEQFHIHQRNNQNYYNNFYIKKLNYIYSKNILFDDWTKKHIITNPDHIGYNWIIKENNKYFLPLLLFINKSPNSQFIIQLEKKKNYYFPILKNKKPNLIPINKFKFFKKFKKTSNIYTPNELIVDNILYILNF